MRHRDDGGLMARGLPDRRRLRSNRRESATTWNPCDNVQDLIWSVV